MVGLLGILLTGFAVYYLLWHPVKSIKAVFVLLGLFLLGSAVWIGLFALVLKL